MKHIQSVNNPLVKEWKKYLSKKTRDKTGTFLVEGFHLVEEAYKADVMIDLIVSEDIDMPVWDYGDIPVFIVTKEIVHLLKDTETSQGIFALCRQKAWEENVAEANTFIALDGIQDPGNLGTIIRTADAAGIDGIIIGEDTVDAYNPKVLRSAQGSHFHLPIVKQSLIESIEELKARRIPIYGTSLENGKNYRELPSSQQQFCIIVGNEGNGVRKEVLEKTDMNLYIPILGKSESLNVAVASGILMYHLR